MMRMSLAETTNKCYQAGWNRWCAHRAAVLDVDELKLSDEDVYQPSEDALLDFVADLTLETKAKPRGLAEKTIRIYLAAITHFHLMNSLPDPKADMHLLAKVMRGVRRHAGAARKPKRPITLTLLKELRQHVDDGALRGKAQWATMCMGVHGLFRLGDRILPPAEGEQHLTYGDIRRVNEIHATVHLRRSKTDQYGKGAHVNLFATGDDTCPLAAITELRRAQVELGIDVENPSTPLFAVGRRGRPPAPGKKAKPYKGKPALLSKQDMVRRLKKAVDDLEKRRPELNLNSKEFAGHSLRRGGATSLALRGVAEPVLRLLGRWESDAVNLYIALPVQSLAEASKVMVSTPERFREADLAAASSAAAAEKWAF